MPDRFSLKGQTALVTGASRGIGRAIALGYAASGAEVIAVARSKDALDDVVHEIVAAGGRAHAITCDVTDERQVEDTVRAAIDWAGKIDILVNNAGGNRIISQIPDLRADGWDKIIGQNLRSVFLLSRAVGGHMRERSSGAIINMSSVAGIGSSPGLAAYGTAKAGVLGLTRSMAMELATTGIRVNAIAPGWIRTDLNANFRTDESAEQAFVQLVPMQRWGEADEIVGTAIYLASSAASYVTGQVIVVDGGLSAR